MEGEGMRQAYKTALAGAGLLVALWLLGGAPQSETLRARSALQGTATPPAQELPPDAKTLELDKPLTESIDPNTSIRFYTFNAKGGQLYRITLEPTSGTFYTTTTIMTLDLETIIGGTIGENLISGSLVVRPPADGTYAISVEFADIKENSPATGSYEIGISLVQPK
jgi:hypothetical protein